ncbi:MAG: fumarylacetoacetate hydrolase family protein [Candidatus Omnitrophota bacterium]
MRIARFSSEKTVQWGIITDKTVTPLKNSPFTGIQTTKSKLHLSNCRLLAPVTPGKIILVGLNYKDHAKELGMKIPKEPIIFLKPPTVVIGHKDKIIYPKGVKRLDYEAELAVIMKRKAKNISGNKAKNYILGYTCLNDVTARDIQKKDGQWTRAKSFDTFCPLGPWIQTNLDPSNLAIKTYLNGKIKQNSNTANFIFPVDYIVSFISKIMTLHPGDVISTGTPPGVGPMRSGDEVTVQIEGIGKLTNSVQRSAHTDNH